MAADFTARRRGFASVEERHEWVRRESGYMCEQGATDFRLTWNPADDEDLVLEGWYARPDWEAEPLPFTPAWRGR